MHAPAMVDHENCRVFVPALRLLKESNLAALENTVISSDHWIGDLGIP